MTSPQSRSKEASPSTSKEVDAYNNDSEGPEPELYQEDDFRMYCMKVLPCSKRYCHDWTICPFSHPGEKARRRDPRVFNYTGIACPDMKSKDTSCARGDLCPYAHNVFEYWLHTSRYRTQLCNDGLKCTRRVCFFAHSLEQLRVPVDRPLSLPEQQHAGPSDASDALHKAGFSQAQKAALAASPVGFSSASSRHQRAQRNDLAEQLAALQLQRAGASQPLQEQEQSTVLELLREMWQNQMQASSETSPFQQGHQPPSEADRMLRSISEPLGYGPAQGRHLLDGLAANEVARQYFFGQQERERQELAGLGGKSASAPQAPLQQGSPMFSPPQLSAAGKPLASPLDRLQEGVQYNYPDPAVLNSRPSFRRAPRNRNRRAVSLEYPLQYQTSPLLLNSGDVPYGFQPTAQTSARDASPGGLIDFSLRRESEESARPSSEYGRSSAELTRASFESVLSTVGRSGREFGGPPPAMPSSMFPGGYEGGRGVGAGISVGGPNGRPSFAPQIESLYSSAPATNDTLLLLQQHQRVMNARQKTREEEALIQSMLQQRQQEMASDPKL